MSSTSATFTPIPRLPYELQAHIYKIAALSAKGNLIRYDIMNDNEVDILCSEWDIVRPTDLPGWLRYDITVPTSGEKITFFELNPGETYAMLKTSRMSRRAMFSILEGQVEERVKKWGGDAEWHGKKFEERTLEVLKDLIQCLK